MSFWQQFYVWRCNACGVILLSQKLRINSIDKGIINDNIDAGDIIDGLGVFRKKWTVKVLLNFKNDDIMTFSALQNSHSLYPSVLSSILKELTSKMLITRKVCDQIFPLRVEYQITPFGKELLVVISHLSQLVLKNKKLDWYLSSEIYQLLKFIVTIKIQTSHFISPIEIWLVIESNFYRVLS